VYSGLFSLIPAIATLLGQSNATFSRETEYVIIAEHSRLGLDVVDAGGEMALLQTAGYGGQANQRFRIIPAHDGYYNIIAVHNDLSFDVRDAGGQMALVQTAGHGGQPNREFRIIDMAPHRFRIEARHSGKSFDVRGAGGQLSLLQTTGYGDQPNQRWLIIPTNPAIRAGKEVQVRVVLDSLECKSTSEGNQPEDVWFTISKTQSFGGNQPRIFRDKQLDNIQGGGKRNLNETALNYFLAPGEAVRFQITARAARRRRIETTMQPQPSEPGQPLKPSVPVETVTPRGPERIIGGFEIVAECTHDGEPVTSFRPFENTQGVNGDIFLNGGRSSYLLRVSVHADPGWNGGRGLVLHPR